MSLHDFELLETLKNEKFDAGFTESLDACGYGYCEAIVCRELLNSVLFHQLEIEKYATTVSLALLDGQFGITQVPVNTAYVPCKNTLYS